MTMLRSGRAEAFCFGGDGRCSHAFEVLMNVLENKSRKREQILETILLFHKIT